LACAKVLSGIPADFRLQRQRSKFTPHLECACGTQREQLCSRS
jgi:hypothetical protein